ncbi:MAG TPA: VWA domain-containing protein, partial [Thermoanaerobaculia bacterium]
MRRLHAIVLRLVGTLVLTATAVHAASRNLAIIVDTSGSMQQNDQKRYTMQLSQVLADLMNAGDELSVIRMPGDFFSSCSAGPSSSLVLQLDPRDRAAFKNNLDGLIQFNTGTYFAAPIRTAISLLKRHSAPQRMLLVIADSGGLGSCESTLTRELLELKQSGVAIAAINLGSSGGAFDTNPAFDFTTSALDAQGLIEAVAMVYQRFLGAKQVQTGRVQGEIRVDIAPFVDEAFLVVAADGPISGIQQVPGNPGA